MATMQKTYEITNIEKYMILYVDYNICYINVNKLMENSARVTNINKLYFNIAKICFFHFFPQ